MTKTIQTESAPSASCAPCPLSTSRALARCYQAYEATTEAFKGKDVDQVIVELRAEKAFRTAMPPLSGYKNIRDFIACAAHGMLIGAISGPTGARLLYAAQVANTTHRSSSRQKKARAA